jgi:hypothetical protein
MFNSLPEYRFICGLICFSVGKYRDNVLKQDTTTSIFVLSSSMYATQTNMEEKNRFVVLLHFQDRLGKTENKTLSDRIGFNVEGPSKELWSAGTFCFLTYLPILCKLHKSYSVS